MNTKARHDNLGLGEQHSPALSDVTSTIRLGWFDQMAIDGWFTDPADGKVKNSIDPNRKWTGRPETSPKGESNDE